MALVAEEVLAQEAVGSDGSHLATGVEAVKLELG